MKSWILTFVLAGTAFPAWAGWTTCPGSILNTGTAYAAASQNTALCFVFANATDPKRVDGRYCGSVDVILNADVTGGGVHTATVDVYQACSNATNGGFTDCQKVLPAGVDVPLNGDSVGNREAIYGMSPGIFAFDLTNPDPQSGRLWFICRSR